ncbi:hypothetical protein AGDE_03984 [Angomonas deanei]|nr:hypothetical protein AGDE_03984 [Angomonas deanei]|eukprot:EPY39944.1 hypothetical protein AGDE_03984 [Angomonas deanei]
MTDINTMHRQKHACTDVLTFTERGREGALVDDLLFGSGPHTTEWSLERRNEGTDFGSIYVCVDYIYKKSFAESHRNLPFSDYLKLSLIHAFLHSIGYNHETADEMTEMIHREQFLTRRISHLERRFPAQFSGIDGLDYMRNKGSIVY